MAPPRFLLRRTRPRPRILRCAQRKMSHGSSLAPNGSPACRARMRKGGNCSIASAATLSRPLNSKYTADEFLTMILPRMQGYVNQSMPSHPQLRRAERLREERGDQRVQVYRGVADYIASINLSTNPTWNFELKTLPRPTGAATRGIYTEYDLPRETIEPPDVIVDSHGMG